VTKLSDFPFVIHCPPKIVRLANLLEVNSAKMALAGQQVLELSFYPTQSAKWTECSAELKANSKNSGFVIDELPNSRSYLSSFSKKRFPCIKTVPSRQYP
jgi:hypothetical protein